MFRAAPRLSSRFLLFAAGLAGCAALLLVRGWYAQNLQFRFLAWNLVLGIVPAVAAAALQHADERRRGLVAFGWAVVWLLFLPNAPYLITDLVHLHPRPPVPYWFDIGVFAAFAGAGVLAAFSSLADVQRVVRRRFGRSASWAVVTVASFAAGFGIELGRMERWNSWDVFTQPGGLLRDVVGRLLAPWAHPRAFAVAMLYGSVLLFGYVAVRVLMAPRPGERVVPARVSAIPERPGPGSQA
jgi:uncharacterized membrane protein